MPHPCPNLQEILALEAKIRGDKYDLFPIDAAGDKQSEQGAFVEAAIENHRNILYIKKS